jgi:hypothetical protein
MQNGKGDKPRRKTVSEEVWQSNWERIFGVKNAKKPKKFVKKHT